MEKEIIKRISEWDFKNRISNNNSKEFLEIGFREGFKQALEMIKSSAGKNKIETSEPHLPLADFSGRFYTDVEIEKIRGEAWDAGFSNGLE
jgi:hypothetical protein